jgi:hypothetical protein
MLPMLSIVTIKTNEDTTHLSGTDLFKLLQKKFTRNALLDTKKHYVIQSMFGRYLDISQNPTVDYSPVMSQHRNRTPTNDTRLGVQIIPENGYYKIRSKHNRYLDMRHEYGNAQVVWTISEQRMTSNQWANDSFLVQLIDQGSMYYRVRSKFGRFLDMRHENTEAPCEALSLSETYMSANPWANESFLVKFIEQDNIDN